MDKVKYFIGPMSKNIVDTIIEYSQETQNLIGFVPSRRQVDYNRGYVNNWNTNEFSCAIAIESLKRLNKTIKFRFNFLFRN